MKRNIAVILSGGAGSRLWPLSRLDEPKQFQAFTDSLSLLSNTVKRADALADIHEILVVCSATHQSLVQQHTQPHTHKPVNYLLEPVARNTAAAITCAALHLQTQHPSQDVCMLVLPSDHHMSRQDLFEIAVQNALQAARLGHLVTFGIVATKPDTGFGYIEMGSGLEGQQVHRVERFVEKPTAERAQEMLSTGKYRWNSGMFVMQTALFLQEIERYDPPVTRACTSALAEAKHHTPFVSLAEKKFSLCPSISVDNAVFERSDKVAVVSLDAPWTDLGSWAAVADIQETTLGVSKNKAEVISVNATQNYVRAAKTVAIIGVSDIVVVDTVDALLITHRDNTQDVKDVVSTLNKNKSQLATGHTRVRRPWGTYESIGNGEQHQVKHIVVQPGGRLSLQSHEHRAEHWVVVSGIATITVGDHTANYEVGQHAYILKGQKHRLENHTKTPVAIVEVQIGGYLGEDDIQRFDDVYGRLTDSKTIETTIEA